jgi:GAF domain-containing protein
MDSPVVFHDPLRDTMVQGTFPNLAGTLTAVAHEINTVRDLDAVLQTIVEVAARSLPGVDHVGITLAHSDGAMETKAATDDFVLQLDRIQYELGEGPCVHAMEASKVVVENAKDDPRWPRFMKPAAELGLRAQMGLRLYADARTLGGLNMYSTTVDAIDPDVEHLAELFAEHASIALGRARREDHLHDAISSRQIIGQATGLIMERYQLNETRAFDYLLRVSSHTNIKVRDVAQELVDEANRDA